MGDKPEVSLKNDPRIRDAAIWNRLRIMVEHDACDRAWGCPLYILHRTGLITTEQREAGDRYHKIVEDHRECQSMDIDEFLPEARDFQRRRIERARVKYEDAIDVLGLGRNIIDWLIIHENSLCGEREKRNARDALQLLANYFGTGIRKRNPKRRFVV